MRVFVFAIGGTGSRVLTQMIMQFAAGVRPTDENGNQIEDLSVVPIIVDPHEQNAALLGAINLLNDYRTIRKQIYGDEPNVKGFFSVKISTLGEIAANDNTSADRFFFSMPQVSNSTFANFINYNDMDVENKMLMQMLFSESERNTNMREGFYGSPNIGTVALGEFKKSKDFELFRSAFNVDSDRIFFIGSIFGGTGAAGLPLFISSIRDLSHIDNTSSGNSRCAEAPIGALIVMPYFAIETKNDSPIDENQFIIKTKSALRYYQDALNKYVNSVYYISDTDRTKNFDNDPGNMDNQRGNRAHVVEYIGATAICDFISTSASDLETVKDDTGRTIAKNGAKFYQYSFDKAESMISYEHLPAATNNLTMLPMMKFFLLKQYMLHHLTSRLRETFAANYEPKIQNSILTREIKAFFTEFERLMNEMRSHESAAHNLSYYISNAKDDFTKAFNTINPKKGIFGSNSLKIGDIEKALNKVAQKYDKMETQYKRWYTIADVALESVIKENLDIAKLI